MNTTDTQLTDNTIRFSIASNPVLIIDEHGIFYKGQRIEDIGEAHKAFLEVMSLMKLAATKP